MDWTMWLSPLIPLVGLFVIVPLFGIGVVWLIAEIDEWRNK